MLEERLNLHSSKPGEPASQLDGPAGRRRTRPRRPIVLILSGFAASLCADSASFLRGHLASLVAGHGWAGPK